MFSEEKEEHLKEYVEPTASTPSASPANVSNISTAAQSGDVPQDDVDEDGYSIKPKWETQTIKKGELIKYIHIVVFYKLKLFVRDFFLNIILSFIYCGPLRGPKKKRQHNWDLLFYNLGFVLDNFWKSIVSIYLNLLQKIFHKCSLWKYKSDFFYWINNFICVIFLPLKLFLPLNINASCLT